MKIEKIAVPISVIIGAIILGWFYLKVESNKQASLERQNLLEFEQKKEEERNRIEEKRKDEENKKKEYINNRKKECLEIEAKEKTHSNFLGSGYNEEKDVCAIVFSTNKYKGVNCNKYENTPEKTLCEEGFFIKEF